MVAHLERLTKLVFDRSKANSGGARRPSSPPRPECCARRARRGRLAPESLAALASVGARPELIAAPELQPLGAGPERRKPSAPPRSWRREDRHCSDRFAPPSPEASAAETEEPAEPSLFGDELAPLSAAEPEASSAAELAPETERAEEDEPTATAASDTAPAEPAPATDGPQRAPLPLMTARARDLGGGVIRFLDDRLALAETLLPLVGRRWPVGPHEGLRNRYSRSTRTAAPASGRAMPIGVKSTSGKCRASETILSRAFGEMPSPRPETPLLKRRALA